MKPLRVALGSVLAYGVAASFACDPAYEAPCRVERDTIVLTDREIATRTAVAIARTANGFTASWVKAETPDAGTDRTPFLAGFEVVDLDANGALLRRDLVAAPRELRERKGSIEAFGVSREEGATLLHWTESVTTTDPDGRIRTAFTFRTAYGDRVLVPPGGSCEKCSMRVATVAFADETIAIVRTEPDVVIPVFGAPLPTPDFVGVRLHRDGSSTAEPLPWLAIPVEARALGTPAVPSGALSAVRDVDGRIVLSSGPTAWRLDRSLRPIAGPVALPSPDARPLWGAGSDATLVWSVSPNEEGRSESQFARREVFLANGAIRERVSHGRAVLGAERRADDVGLAFESAGRLFFAVSSARGQKRGGDVFVRSIMEGGSQFGDFNPEDATSVGATSPGHFTLVTLGRTELRTAEVVCAP